MSPFESQHCLDGVSGLLPLPKKVIVRFSDQGTAKSFDLLMSGPENMNDRWWCLVKTLVLLHNKGLNDIFVVVETPFKINLSKL
jgi:hypothetical protein